MFNQSKERMDPKTFERTIFFIVIAITSFLWAQGLGSKDVTAHPTFTQDIVFSQKGLRTILFNMKWSDQSPLYYVLLRIFSVFGQSTFAICSVNFFTQIANLIALYFTTRLLVNQKKLPLIAMALLASLPLMYWNVRDGRMYPILMLMTTMAIYFVFKYLKKPSKKSLTGLILCCALSIYDHYLGFLVTSVCMVFLFSRLVQRAYFGEEKNRDDLIILKQAMTALMILVILTLPQFSRLVIFMTEITPPRIISLQPPAMEAFRVIIEHLYIQHIEGKETVSLFGSAGFESLFKQTYLMAVIALFCLGFALVKNNIKIFTLLWLAAGVMLLLQVGKYDIRARYFLPLLPLLVILMTLGAFGPLNLILTKQGPFKSILDILRKTMFVWIIAISSASFVRSIPNNPPEWYEILTEINDLYTADTVVITDCVRQLKRVQKKYKDDPRVEKIKNAGKSLFVYTRTITDDYAGKNIIFIRYYTKKNWTRHNIQKYLDARFAKKEVIRSDKVQFYFYQNKDRMETPKAVDLRNSRLSQQIEKLKVSRVTEDKSKHTSTVYAASAQSAQEMHEFESDGRVEGWVRERWRLGEAAWEVVGRTRQQIGAQRLDGVWAHPKKNTTLVIESKNILAGEEINGFVALTDYSSRRREKLGIVDPIVFKLFQGDEQVYSIDYRVGDGMQSFNFSLNENLPKDIKITITATKDKWAHFIFDLWSQ